MIKVVRHCKLYSRSLIPNKIVGVRFLCDHCDCLFEASGDDLDVDVVSAKKFEKEWFRRHILRFS